MKRGAIDAIVLGIDSPIGLTVVRELGEHGVAVMGIGRSRHALGRYSRHCAAFRERPTGPLEHWLPRLIDECRPRALLAVSEGDLIALAKLPEVIGGCTILTPRAPQLDQVLDKQRTLRVAQKLGIDVPAQWSPIEEDDFGARARDLHYPVALKWSNPNTVFAALDAHGIAWEKAEIVRTPAALLQALERYRPVQLWPMVQEFCPGVGLGQMLYMDGGRATLAFQHLRLHEWPPEGGISTLCRAEPRDLHRAQMAKSLALLAALDWQGPAMVEYRYDPDSGRYALMEVNGRFWGSLPLAYHAGACFAWEYYRRQILASNTVTPTYRERIRARYLTPDIKRLVRILLSARRGKLAEVLAFVAHSLDPRMRYYVWSLRDPMPALADMARVILKVLRLAR